MSEATPETGALTFDAAVHMLAPASEPTEAPDAPQAATEEPEEPQGDASTPEEAQAEPEEPADGEEEQAEAVETPLDPPLYWKPEAKEAFAKLEPALQAEILSQEGPREEAASRAKAEAAAEREAARVEVSKVQALAEHLGAFLPEAVQAFRTQWGDQEPDWEALIEQYGVEETAKLQARYSKQRTLLAQTQQAQQLAAQQARKAELEQEFAALADLDPELAPDPKDASKGTEKRAEVASYLRAQGYPDAEVSAAGARDFVIAKKAMLYDRIEAARKAAPPKKPAPPAPRAPVRPAASAGAPNPSRQAANRFAQTRNVEDAVALLLASKGK